MPRRDISFAWGNEHSDAAALARFMADCLDPSYISHGEIQCGRAKDEHTFADDLVAVLERELGSTLTSHAGRLAVAHRNDELTALAIVELAQEAAQPYAVVEDVVVSREHRGDGLGTAFLGWLETELHALGIERLFLESGIGNHSAHRFFERHGYSVCSKVMTKVLR